MREAKGAVILAGGKSSRLGRNKAFILLQNKPLVRHVYDTVASVCESIVLTTKPSRGASRYSTVLPSSVRVAYDVTKAQTPLVGILSGFSALNTQYAMVVACDMPFIKVEVIRHLFNSAGNSDTAVPVWPDGSVEPLFAVYNVRRAKESFESTLRAGLTSPQKALKALKRVNYVSVEAVRKYDPHMVSFFNINTEADLRVARRLIRKGL